MAAFVSTKIEGMDRLTRKLRLLPAAIQNDIETAQKINALDLQNTARRLILSGSKSGRIYKRRNKSGGITLHQASAPGESPASDFGTLVSSVRGFVEKRFTAALEAATAYAAALEFGSRKRHILPRPFMNRALDIVSGRAKERLIAALRGTLRRKR